MWPKWVDCKYTLCGPQWPKWVDCKYTLCGPQWPKWVDCKFKLNFVKRLFTTPIIARNIVQKGSELGLRGSVLDWRSGFDFQHNIYRFLYLCGPSVAKEVKDVFWHPGARVGVGSTHYRPLAIHGIGCPA